ncbi:hypothetical protein VTN00DRAFT_4827 [Thermoascus crustaceus]|uniref:uncharacterized protein n=1 Tax=Thermoascus crustaceus TaxID=5088 RepID=UPI0037433536
MYWHLYLSCEKLSGGINCCQHCYLRYKLVQLALRTHSLTSPAHGIPVSALAHSCVTTTWQGQRPQFELLPKIVEGRFMLRLRYRVRVTFANNDGDGEDVLSQVECLNGLCQHSWGCVPAICHCAVRQIITGRMEKKKKKKCIGCNLIRRCKLCAPECQVTLEDVRADSDSDSCAVVVTAWKDLGAPRSPLSEPWRSHRSDYCVPEHPYLGQVAGFRYGLKAAFEGVEGLEPQVEGEGEVLRFRM